MRTREDTRLEKGQGPAQVGLLADYREECRPYFEGWEAMRHFSPRNCMFCSSLKACVYRRPTENKAVCPGLSYSLCHSLPWASYPGFHHQTFLAALSWSASLACCLFSHISAFACDNFSA